MKTVFTYGDYNPYKPNHKMIELQVSSRGNRFNVIYGAQKVSQVDYVSAAHELGECIMHYLACESKFFPD